MSSTVNRLNIKSVEAGSVHHRRSSLVQRPVETVGVESAWQNFVHTDPHISTKRVNQ